MSAEPKRFPVMYERNAKPGPTTIPWETADRAYSVYSARYGKEQSLERIAERGGFGARELDEFIPGWRDELSEFRALEARHARVREAAERLVSAYAATERLPSTANRVAERTAAEALRAALEDKA